MLARADFTKALKGFDPRTLHAHPDLAASVRLRLAELAHASSARRSAASTAADGERARPWRALRNSQGGSQGGPSSVGSVGQTALYCCSFLPERRRAPAPAPDLQDKNMPK